MQRILQQNHISAASKVSLMVSNKKIFLYNGVPYISFLNLQWYHNLTPWRLGGFGDFCKKTAVFVCLTNALAPPPIALESCSMA